MKELIKTFVWETVFSICGTLFADFYCERCNIEHKGTKCPLETMLGDVNSLNHKQVLTLLGALGKRSRELMDSDETDFLAKKFFALELENESTPSSSPVSSQKDMINIERTQPTYSLVFDRDTLKPILLINGKKDSRITDSSVNTIDNRAFFFEFKENSIRDSITYTPAAIYVKENTNNVFSDTKENVLKINGKTVQGFSMAKGANRLLFHAKPSSSKNKANESDQIKLSLLFQAGSPDQPILLIDGEPAKDFILKNKSRYSLGSCYTFEHSRSGTIVFYPPVIQFSALNLLILDGKSIQGFSANHVGKYSIHSGSNANQPDCTFEFGGAIMVDSQTLPKNNEKTKANGRPLHRVKVRARRH